MQYPLCMNKIIPFCLVGSSGLGNLALGEFCDLFGVKAVWMDGMGLVDHTPSKDCYDYLSNCAVRC